MTRASASAQSVVLHLVLMTFTKFICHSTQQYFYVIGTVNELMILERDIAL